MAKFITVESNGITFCARRVDKGDKYGLNFCLTLEEDKPMIEFYDTRYILEFTSYGQFICRYYLETLQESNLSRGLNLDSSVADWNLSGHALVTVLNKLG